MDYVALVRVLVRKSPALTLLQLYPLGSDAKPSALGSFVGLQQATISLAIVEDLGVGLRQPVRISCPNRLIVLIEFLLEVISVLVGNILELRDLGIICPSWVEPFILLRSYEPEYTARALFYTGISTSLAKVQSVTLEVVLARQLLPLKHLFLNLLSVLILGVIEYIVLYIQVVLVRRSLLLVSYTFKCIVKLEDFLVELINKPSYILDRPGRIPDPLVHLSGVLFYILQLAIGLGKLLLQVVNLFIEEYNAQPLPFARVPICPLPSIVVLG